MLAVDRPRRPGRTSGLGGTIWTSGNRGAAEGATLALRVRPITGRVRDVVAQMSLMGGTACGEKPEAKRTTSSVSARPFRKRGLHLC